MSGLNRKFMGFQRRQLQFGIAGLVSLCILAGCQSKAPEEAEPEPEVTVDVAPVLGTSSSEKIASHAVIYPIQQSPVSPKISAPIRKLYV